MIKTIKLVKRCKDGYDIYYKYVSSLSYAPNVYTVAKDGRMQKEEIASQKEAEDYIESCVFFEKAEDVLADFRRTA